MSAAMAGWEKKSAKTDKRARRNRRFIVVLLIMFLPGVLIKSLMLETTNYHESRLTFPSEIIAQLPPFVAGGSNEDLTALAIFILMPRKWQLKV